MNVHDRPKIVVLGMISKTPVAGMVWLTVQYLLGLKRLGYDAYYVEAHRRTPSMLMEGSDDDGSGKAAAFIGGIMQRFGFRDRWAFHALHADGACYGMSEGELMRLYQSAELLLNLHGGTMPLPEHSATERLVYLGTDPGRLEAELAYDHPGAIAMLEAHCAFFTWGENYGNPDCRLPVSTRFPFHPTRQPVVLDLWQQKGTGTREVFTTISHWKQPGGDFQLQDRVYHWSKHQALLEFVDLPRRTRQPLELALAGCDEADRRMLEAHGWRVRDALGFSWDVDRYRGYILGSRGEFTAAKDQYVRTRSGWFSDRSATYLAAGKPVVTQDTGFSNILPTGEGLFAFSTLDDAVAAFEKIQASYERHSRAAFEIAREYFSHDLVLKRLLTEVGVSIMKGAATTAGPPFPATLDLVPVSRWPLRLPDETVQAVMKMAVRAVAPRSIDGLPEVKQVSIVIVTFNNLVFTRLCLESLLANTGYPSYEVIVVDNGSTDGTADYLRELARYHPHVQAVFNDANRGFAPASNQGLALASGDVLVLLNNDTIVPRGWLEGLVAHLDDPTVGLVGPVTNRIGNEAEIKASYRTYGEFEAFAQAHTHSRRREIFDIRTSCMFCLALRRDVYERIGTLDEQFEVGMFEDDDYAMRARAAGYRVVCAEGVFIHHFDQASIGKLALSREYGELFHTNRQRFERKWSIVWEPHHYRLDQEYLRLTNRIRKVVRGTIPPEAIVIVVSKGDRDLLRLDGRRGWHFPQSEDGTYAGYYPADSAAAIHHLEVLRDRGGEFLLFPSTAFWWLEHYPGFRQHLQDHYRVVVCEEEICRIYALEEGTHEAAA